MNAFLIWLLAMVRRFATVSGSAIITFIIDNFPDWLIQSIGKDATIILYMGIITLIIEAMQKGAREYFKSKKLYG